MNLSKIDKAHIVALIGMLGTGVAAIVPAWSSEVQAIVASLGGIVSLAYPIVKAVEKMADSNVSAKDVEAGAIAAARAEVGKVDFNALVQSAVSAQSIPDLESKISAAAQAEVRRLLGQLALTPATPTTQR